MHVRRASVDVVPRGEQSSTESGGSFHIYEHSQFSQLSSCMSSLTERSIQSSIQSLVDNSSTASRSCSNDLEKVSSMLDLIFRHVADNTSFFSETKFPDNLQQNLTSHLKKFHRTQADIWKRQMILSMQADKMNVCAIRKLIRVNGFDLESEIRPILQQDEQYKAKRAPKSHTALTWASYRGNIDLVKCLVNEGANPNTFTSEGIAAIHCCSMKNENLPVLKYYLEHPRLETDVDFCNDQNGITPLMCACLFGAYKVAECLLEGRAEVNKQDNDGKSSIYYAVENGHLKVVKLLVGYNACVYLRDNQDSNILYHLIIAHMWKKVTTNSLTEIMIYLVDDRGLEVTNKALNGCTALHEACRNGLTDVAKYLVEKGAKLEAKKDGWETPLWSLVMSESPRTKLIILMLEKGANFDAINCLGMTMLQYARTISKNQSLIAVLEEAQKILRTNRMKAAIAKRRAILGDGIFTASTRDARHIPFGTRSTIRWPGAIAFVTKEPFDRQKEEGDEDNDIYSSISSSDSLHDSDGEDDDDDTGGNEDTSTTGGANTQTVATILGGDRDCDSEHSVTVEYTSINEITINVAETTTLNEEEISLVSSSEGDDDDFHDGKYNSDTTNEDRDSINYLPAADETGHDQLKKEFIVEAENIKIKKDPDSGNKHEAYTHHTITNNNEPVVLPPPLNNIKYNSSYDEMESLEEDTFERLLRRKRLLEDLEQQQKEKESDRASLNFRTDERNVGIPQKIKCVRRFSVIESDESD